MKNQDKDQLIDLLSRLVLERTNRKSTIDLDSLRDILFKAFATPVSLEELNAGEWPEPKKVPEFAAEVQAEHNQLIELGRWVKEAFETGEGLEEMSKYLDQAIKQHKDRQELKKVPVTCGTALNPEFAADVQDAEAGRMLRRIVQNGGEEFDEAIEFLQSQRDVHARIKRDEEVPITRDIRQSPEFAAEVHAAQADEVAGAAIEHVTGGSRDIETTLADYNGMLLRQAGRCAICRRHVWDLDRALVVDHNHKTGEIRGLLCNGCNRAIGMLEDDSKLLIEAAQYLEDNNAS